MEPKYPFTKQCTVEFRTGLKAPQLAPQPPTSLPWCLCWLGGQVGSEETLLEIQDRYLDYNKHADSYSWKVRAPVEAFAGRAAQLCLSAFPPRLVPWRYFAIRSQLHPQRPFPLPPTPTPIL